MELRLGNNKFTLTSDFMNTMIEDLEDVNHPKAIVLNCLAICSIAERGNDFCFDFAVRNNGVLHLQADIFQLRAEFYSDGTIILISMNNPQRVKTHLKYIVDYYNNVLCNIMIKENMNNATEFANKEKDKMKKIKDDKKTN